MMHVLANVKSVSKTLTEVTSSIPHYEFAKKLCIILRWIFRKLEGVVETG
jgi:hypothetical protein